MKILFLVTIFISFACVADTWKFKAEIIEKSYTFGDVTVKNIIDGTKNQNHPRFTVEIYNKNVLKGLYAGVSFQNIQASPDTRNFIAISNDGLPGSAIIIFNKEGELIVHVPHNFAAMPLTYCSQSTTKVRLWYNKDNPSIEFSKNGSVITLLGCDGRRLNITEMLN